VLVTRGLSEMHMNVHPLAKHSPRLVPLAVVCCVCVCFVCVWYADKYSLSAAESSS
jgi:NO-binding membrane sensor protein with MHYT domain